MVLKITNKKLLENINLYKKNLRFKQRYSLKPQLTILSSRELTENAEWRGLIRTIISCCDGATIEKLTATSQLFVGLNATIYGNTFFNCLHSKKPESLTKLRSEPRLQPWFEGLGGGFGSLNSTLKMYAFLCIFSSN